MALQNDYGIPHLALATQGYVEGFPLIVKDNKGKEHKGVVEYVDKKEVTLKASRKGNKPTVIKHEDISSIEKVRKENE